MKVKPFTRNVGIVAIFFIGLLNSPGASYGQAPTGSLAQPQTQSRPSFEVATIKPAKSGTGLMGFMSYPDGRVVVGNADLKTLVSYALGVREFQVAGGPGWVGSDRYNITALLPAELREEAPTIAKAIPSEDQRRMLRTLLEDRFALKFHREYRNGPVYILSRGKKTLMLQEPKYKNSDPRVGVFMMPGGIADGTALGNNVSTKFMAAQLSPSLGRPVLDRTGLTGSYDFRLGPDDPSNHDIVTAIIDDMDRLGLKLKAGKGPVETIVIDHANKPTEN